MRFKGDTFFCDYCGREFSEDDDAGFEYDRVCNICASRLYNDFLNSKCIVCGKKMGKDEDPWTNFREENCHSKCIKEIPDDKLEEDEWVKISDQF